MNCDDKEILLVRQRVPVGCTCGNDLLKCWLMEISCLSLNLLNTQLGRLSPPVVLRVKKQRLESHQEVPLLGGQSPCLGPRRDSEWARKVGQLQ